VVLSVEVLRTSTQIQRGTNPDGVIKPAGAVNTAAAAECAVQLSCGSCRCVSGEGN